MERFEPGQPMPQEASPEGPEQEPLSYDQLSPAEKVRAILATVKEPVTKDFALELGGIVPDTLSPDELETVEAVFNSSEVDTSQSEHGQQYQLSDSARQSLESTVNLQTAHKQIADVLWSSMFPEGA